jgi:hypothetical protein
VSVHVTIPSPPMPPPTVLVPPSLTRDATTRAVLRYFDAGRGDAPIEHAAAFDGLVAICYTATQAIDANGGPYFLRDRTGSVTVDGVPQFDSMGRRTGYSIREEGSAPDATRQWIQDWLLGFLASYHRKSEAEITAAADAGGFRHLAWQCRFDLIDEVRSQTRTVKHALPPHVSLNAPIGEDGDTLVDQIGTDRRDAPSSLATRPGIEEVMQCVRGAFHAAMANADELRRLDVLDGIRAVLGNAEHLEDRYFNGYVTRTIARLRQVSERAARAYKREFHEVIVREMRSGNPAVRAVFLELAGLIKGGPGVGTYGPRTAEASTALTLDRAMTETYFQDHGCAWDVVDEPEK